MLILSLLNVHLMSVLPIDDFIFQHSENPLQECKGFFIDYKLIFVGFLL